MIWPRCTAHCPVNSTRPGCDCAPRVQGAVHSRHPAVVGDLLAALDHRAVDVTDEHRRELAGRDDDHRLVHQAQPVGHPAGVHRSRPCAHSPNAVRSSAPNRRAVVEDSSATVRGRLELARQDVAQHAGAPEIAALDHVVGDLGQQALAAPDPATRDGGLPGGEQGQRQPEGGTHGAEHVTGVVVHLVGALQRLDAVVVPAEQVGRGGQAHEVVAVEGGGSAAGQRVVGRHPVASLVGLSGLRQVVDHAHRGSPPLEDSATRGRVTAASGRHGGRGPGALDDAARRRSRRPGRRP